MRGFYISPFVHGSASETISRGSQSSILPPFWLPCRLPFGISFSQKGISKSTSKFDATSNAILTPFGSNLAPIWLPKWGPARDPHRTRTLFFRPPSPMLLQVAIWTPFGPIFHRFCLHFDTPRRPYFHWAAFLRQNACEIAMISVSRKYTGTPRSK